MDRRILLLLAVALTGSAVACKRDAENKPAAASAAPLALGDLEAMIPQTLAGLPRQLVVPSPEVNQVSAYYQDPGNTRSGHVTFTLLSDPPRTLEYYQGRFPDKSAVGGRALYSRQYQPNTRPETAEGCLMVAEAIGVCVDLAPAVLADLPPIVQALPLAELEKRAAAK